MNYALLVGVNEYDSPKVSNLKGPVNDVALIKEYLEQTDQDWSIQSLVSEGTPPTRQHIIKYFREFLGQAKVGEIALFYFSGHGALERSPESFISHQQDEFHETIVPSDYQQGDYLLADKEIQVLIREVKAKGPDMVVIFDCCHSGSGIRFEPEEVFTPRQLPKEKQSRPLESFLEGVQAEPQEPVEAYFLAGSSPRQLSIEKPIGLFEPRPTYGVFTRSLIDVLKQAKVRGGISYHELMSAVRLKVAYYLPNGHPQTPQLEITGDLSSQALFLNHAVEASPMTHLVSWHDRSQQWMIQLGAVHGISGEGRYRLLTKTSEGEIEELGTVQIQALGIYQSPLTLPQKVQDLLYKSQYYQAIEISAPRKKLPIYDPQGLLSPANFPQANSLSPKVLIEEQVFTQEWISHHLQASPDKQGTRYQINLDSEGIHLRYTENEEPLAGSPWSLPPRNNPHDPVDKAGIQALSAILRRVNKWETLRHLEGEWFFRLDMPQLVFESQGRSTESTLVTLDWEPNQNINFALKAQSSSSLPYYVHTLYLSRHYQIFTLPHDVLKVESGEAAKEIYSSKLGIIPSSSGQYPAQVFNVFQVLFSQDPLPNLGLDEKQPLQKALETTRYDFDPRSGFTFRAEADKYPQWFTATLVTKILYTQAYVGSSPISLATYGLQISSHPQFRAGVSFASSAEHLQASTEDRYLRLLAESKGVSVLEWGNSGLLTQLEMHHIEQAKSLTQKPLKLILKRNVPPDFRLWAVTLPAKIPTTPGPIPVLGEWEPIGDGQYQLQLGSIPPNPDDGRLEPGHSLKIVTLMLPPEADEAEKVSRWFV